MKLLLDQESRGGPGYGGSGMFSMGKGLEQKKEEENQLEFSFLPSLVILSLTLLCIGLTRRHPDQPVWRRCDSRNCGFIIILQWWLELRNPNHCWYECASTKARQNLVQTES